MANIPDRTFACDAMLGGLARWLRAAGYDASWHPGIEDRDLVALARREGRLLLTSDAGILLHGAVRDHEVSAFFIPHGLGKREQLGFVLRQLNLDLRQQRCMACGGALAEIAKEAARGRVPPRSFAWADRFYECLRCGRVFWPGTHWRQIRLALEQAIDQDRGPGPGGAPPDASP